ncbi:hypothetical protein [Nocardioides sp. GXZ039]|uniref:hypothetical protein n=1 Tax=Nocardioides sp. GXZ039 TaxID=3136018 RepID=UPI0030F48123
MSGFSVDPEVVRGAGLDMHRLALAVGMARTCVENNVHVDTGGTFLNEIARVANDDLRVELLDDYGTRGTAFTAFSNAGLALTKMADDYQSVDAAQAAKIDAVMDTDSGPAPVYMGGDPSVWVHDYSFVTAEVNGFEGFDQLLQFSENVEYIVGLDSISGWTTAAGIVDPLRIFREKLKGDWEKLGKVIGALDNLSAFWTKVSADVRGVPAKFTGNWVEPPGGPPFYQGNAEYGGAPNWSGKAASATAAWMEKVGGKADDHEYAIYLLTTGIRFRLQAMYQAMDLLLDTVQDLIEILPWGQSFDDFVKDTVLPWRQAERLKKIVGAVGKVVTRVDALLILVQELLGVFSSLVASIHDLGFPEAGYDAPDVNGPGK